MEQPVGQPGKQAVWAWLKAENRHRPPAATIEKVPNRAARRRFIAGLLRTKRQQVRQQARNSPVGDAAPRSVPNQG